MVLLKLAVLHVLLLLPAVVPVAAVEAEDTCRDLLQEFQDDSLLNKAVPYTGSNMLFFLHIPRTAGGTLNCLLRATVAPQLRCPSAYKTLPDASVLENCTFVASHDDFSAMQQLPSRTAVITELRDPVDRVLQRWNPGLSGHGPNRTACNRGKLADSLPWTVHVEECIVMQSLCNY
jgi:hypothetical protein